MRYFFNLVDGSVDTDRNGTDLPDLNAARVHAVHVAAEFLKDNPLPLGQGRDIRIEITNENRLVLSTLIIIGIDSAAATNMHTS